jgi:hypothetical protein
VIAVKWDKVQKGARDKGVLVYAMDQAQTVVMTQPGPWGNAYSGFCAGLARRWIALRYDGKDYPFDASTQVLEMPDWQATRDQNIGEDVSGDLLERLEAVFKQYNMSVNKGRVTEKNTAATGAMLEAAAGEGCYYVALCAVQAADTASPCSVKAAAVIVSSMPTTAASCSRTAPDSSPLSTTT